MYLDAGTNNEQYLRDPLYLGMRKTRPPTIELYSFVDEFVEAVQQVFPKCCIHFEIGPAPTLFTCLSVAVHCPHYGEPGNSRGTYCDGGSSRYRAYAFGSGFHGRRRSIRGRLQIQTQTLMRTVLIRSLSSTFLQQMSSHRNRTSKTRREVSRATLPLPWIFLRGRGDRKPL
jgi:hypothetical protein